MHHRYIPIDEGEDVMLDMISEISGDFAPNVWDALSEQARDEIYDPLVICCKMYNEGKLDFDSDFYYEEYQTVLRLIPKNYLWSGPLHKPDGSGEYLDD